MRPAVFVCHAFNSHVGGMAPLSVFVQLFKMFQRLIKRLIIFLEKIKRFMSAISCALAFLRFSRAGFHS
jgi:hypothetical protein